MEYIHYDKSRNTPFSFGDQRIVLLLECMLDFPLSNGTMRLGRLRTFIIRE